MAEISVIVPIYNVEPYLRRCIDSVLAQTFADFELILVDDGSPDACGAICDEYAKQDSRIAVIHQENKGVSAARNAGLKIATGNYVSFIDPDDWIEPEMVQTMVSAMKNERVQLVCCRWDNVYENGEKNSPQFDHGKLGRMAASNFLERLFDFPRSVAGSCCNKLFMRDHIKNFFDEQLKIAEDNMFLMKYCLSIESAYFMDNEFYHVFSHSESATRSDPNKLAQECFTRRKIADLLYEKRMKAAEKAEDEFFAACLRVCRSKDERMEEKTKQDVFSEMHQYTKKNFWRLIKNRAIKWTTKILYIREGLF